jgi:hypothetical protein
MANKMEGCGQAPVILATWEAEIRQKARPYLKITPQKKRDGGLAQVVEYPPSNMRS